MPLYEYICEQTGETIELIRPMADADKPLSDAELGPGRSGQHFTRKLSTFSPKSGSTAHGAPLPVAPGGCCPCGKNAGTCGMN